MDKLFMAIEAGDAAIVEEIIPEISDTINDIHNNETALTFAANYDNPEIIKLLMDAGAAKGKSNMKGMAPEKIAMLNGNYDVLRALKEHQVRNDHTNNEEVKLSESELLVNGVNRMLKKLFIHLPSTYQTSQIAMANLLWFSSSKLEQKFNHSNDPWDDSMVPLMELNKDQNKFNEFLAEFLKSNRSEKSVLNMAIVMRLIDSDFDFKWMDADIETDFNLKEISAALLLWDIENNSKVKASDIDDLIEYLFNNIYRDNPESLYINLPKVGFLTPSLTYAIANNFLERFSDDDIKRVIKEKLNSKNSLNKDFDKSILSFGLKEGVKRNLTDLKLPYMIDQDIAKNLFNSPELLESISKFDFFNEVNWHEKYMSWELYDQLSVLDSLGIKFNGDIQELGNQVIGVADKNSEHLMSAGINQKHQLLTWAKNNGFNPDRVHLNKLSTNFEGVLNSSANVWVIEKWLGSMEAFLYSKKSKTEELNYIRTLNRVIDKCPSNLELNRIGLLIARIAKRTSGINSSDDNGVSLLMKAASNSDTQLVEILLENKADIYAIDNAGNNALSYLAKSDKGKYLVDKCADVLINKHREISSKKLLNKTENRMKI